MSAHGDLQIVERDIYDEGDEDGKNDPPHNALRSCLGASSSCTRHFETPIRAPSVELTGAARLYRAASSDQRERG